MATNAVARCLNPERRCPMQILKETITRDFPTLAQDFAGAAALVVVLVVALNLPGLV